jgi:hypothetical protein
MQQFQQQNQQAIAAIRQQQQQGTAAMQQQQQQLLEQMQQIVCALPSGRECDVAIDAEGGVLDLSHLNEDENGHEFGDGSW